MKFKIKQCTTLAGKIEIGGAKNSCLPLIACCLLTKEQLVLENIPLITDVINMIKIMEKLHVKVNYHAATKTLTLQAVNLSNKALFEEVTKIRASYYIMGSVLNRKKHFSISYPGGCNLGERPIDYHIDAFKALGCHINFHDGYIHIKNKTLKGAHLNFEKISVGATINALFAAVKAKGVTIIDNAASEPEVIDVINCLQKMGADIHYTSSNQITIKGVKKMSGTTHRVMFDRIELGSYLFLAASIKNSAITLQNIGFYKDYQPIIKELTDILTQVGLHMQFFDNRIEVNNIENIQGVEVKTGPFPHFPTDLQAPLTVMLLNASGESVVEETIFQNRFFHVDEVIKMAGDMRVEGNKILIKPSRLQASTVRAHDLRAGFGLIIAAAMAKGTTIIDNAEVILRGYESIIDKLIKIGIMIEQVYD